MDLAASAMEHRPICCAMAPWVVLWDMTRPCSGLSLATVPPPEFCTDQLPAKPYPLQLKLATLYTVDVRSTWLMGLPFCIHATRLIGFHVEPTWKPQPPPSASSTA